MNGYDPHSLLDLIGEIVRLTDLEHPETVTQPAFDRKVAAEERFARVPPARSLTRFFLQGWRDLVELSLRSPQSRAQTLAMRTRTEQALWLTSEAAAASLRLVCRRLGGELPSPEAYRRERKRLIKLAGRGGREVEESMPTENQIETMLGDWDDALRQAGLGDRPPRTAPPPRRGVSILDVLDRCYEHHRTQPTRGEIELFAQANGIPFPKTEPGKSFPEYIAEWKARRETAGLEVPDRPPPKRDRPDYGVDVGAARSGEHRAVRRWTPEMLAQWVDRFLDELPPGVSPTERVWSDWAHEIKGAPGKAPLINHGGFSANIQQGRDRRKSPARTPHRERADQARTAAV